ncbi:MULTISPECIES: hypothetical protein [unclassified Mycolicibacterium]|uniref:Uncharacterized protein n=1 Tax=Mycolicibacterium sp. CBMA 213 TaxID=1968788 RepID=A0A343VRI8_9MYCO|nr:MULTISPECIES: hypothetical protein [unclassified Mycolicibacterium]AVN58512.1 hypothetical protein B5P44_p00217 [Mycolicibacterium sp. CBMA 213]
MPTTDDLFLALGLYVGMWGVGYIVIELAKARQRKNQKQTTGEN